MSKKMEQRAKERPTIQAFLAYLEEHQITKTYDFDEKEAYLPVIDAYFPEANLINQVAAEKKREKYVLAIKSKYNGRLIMELFPDLKGKDLGNFMKGFQEQWEDHEKTLYELEAKEIVRLLKEFYNK